MTARIDVLPSFDALTTAAAEQVVSAASAAVQASGRFNLALAGGSTPRPLYALLATPEYAARIDWARVHVYWSDERCVPPTHRDSNYAMAHEALLAHVPVPSDQVHRIHGEADPNASALAYEEVLRRTLKGSFDLILLGLGRDGHTASLFPRLRALHAFERWVLAQYVETVDMWRITLTPLVINAAAHVLFLVSGSEKASALKRTLEGDHDPDNTPAQMISPTTGKLHWLVDAAAAAELAPG